MKLFLLITSALFSFHAWGIEGNSKNSVSDLKQNQAVYKERVRYLTNIQAIREGIQPKDSMTVSSMAVEALNHHSTRPLPKVDCDNCAKVFQAYSDAYHGVVDTIREFSIHPPKDPDQRDLMQARAEVYLLYYTQLGQLILDEKENSKGLIVSKVEPCKVDDRKKLEQSVAADMKELISLSKAAFGSRGLKNSNSLSVRLADLSVRQARKFETTIVPKIMGGVIASIITGKALASLFAATLISTGITIPPALIGGARAAFFTAVGGYEGYKLAEQFGGQKLQSSQVGQLLTSFEKYKKAPKGYAALYVDTITNLDSGMAAQLKGALEQSKTTNQKVLDGWGSFELAQKDSQNKLEETSAELSIK